MPDPVIPKVEDPTPEEKLATAEAEIEGLKQTAELQADQINLYKANVPESVPAVAPESNEFTGLADDDVITVGDLKKIMGGQDQKYGGIVTELEFKTQHNDFDAVVETYLPGLVKGRPDLTKALRSSGNPALLAYELIKSSEQYVKDAAEGKLKAATNKATEESKQILENAEKPGAVSAAPGGGASNNSVAFYLGLDDDALEKHIVDIKRKE